MTIKNSMILEPTEMEAWKKFITDVSQTSHIKLSNNTESHLFFSLMRYIRNPKILLKPIAIDFLESEHKTYGDGLDRLQQTGDQCVIIAGLFPGLAKRRLVKASYYTNLAYSSYLNVSVLAQHEVIKSRFEDLASNTVNMITLLGCSREQEFSEPCIAEAWAESLLNKKPMQ